MFRCPTCAVCWVESRHTITTRCTWHSYFPTAGEGATSRGDSATYFYDSCSSLPVASPVQQTCTTCRWVASWSWFPPLTATVLTHLTAGQAGIDPRQRTQDVSSSKLNHLSVLCCRWRPCRVCFGTFVTWPPRTCTLWPVPSRCSICLWEMSASSQVRRCGNKRLTVLC